MRNALEKLASDFVVRQNQMQELMAQYDTVDQVYQALQGDPRLKRSNVPVGMALDYRIWDLTEADKADALAKYTQARAAMGDEEFAARFAAGTISQDMFDKSAVYRACVVNYIAKAGKLNQKERLQFEDASDEIVRRVLADTSIVFTTCSNAGGKLLEEGTSFKPSVIFCNEAGQVGLASLCVPLTIFHDWEGVFLFGDTCQLEPTVLSGGFNEFINNARISPLALLDLKGFPQYLLDTQCRMSPAISNFPNQQFYHGKLTNHPSASCDNANRTRDKICRLSKRLGANGFKGRGSEYFLLDVKHGASRIEANGTSLVNHANADTIIILIKDMIDMGVQPGEIKILCYYQGQRRLLREKISETLWEQGIKDAIQIPQIHTVDAFQGKESSVIVVDMVTARDPLMFKSLKGNRNAQALQAVDDQLDNGTEAYVKLGSITGDVRNGKRLNVALTRAMHGLVVVCQEALLVGDPKATKNRGKHYNAISNMCMNARTRNCYVLDDQTEDSHPQSLVLRESLQSEDIKTMREKQTSADLGYIGDLRRSAQELKNKKPDSSIKVPKYRTVKGHTTRPIEESPALVAAEKHDRERELAEKMELARLRSLESAKHEQELALAKAMSRSETDTQFPSLPSASKDNHDTMEGLDNEPAKGDKSPIESVNAVQGEDFEPEFESGDEDEHVGGHFAEGEGASHSIGFAYEGEENVFED